MLTRRFPRWWSWSWSSWQNTSADETGIYFMKEKQHGFLCITLHTWLVLNKTKQKCCFALLIHYWYVFFFLFWKLFSLIIQVSSLATQLLSNSYIWFEPQPPWKVFEQFEAWSVSCNMLDNRLWCCQNTHCAPSSPTRSPQITRYAANSTSMSQGWTSLHLWKL